MCTTTCRGPAGSSRSRRVAAAAVALVLGVALAGCSGDEGDESSPPDQPGAGAPAAPESVPVKVHPGKLAGSLKPRKRKVAVRVVGTVVDRWLAAAYVEGDYPRKRFPKAKTYPGFTKELAARAARDRNLTSNAGIGEKVDGVVARQRIIVVDLLAPKDRIAGATARVRLMLDTEGKLERRVLVTGRVALTKARSGHWRIFSYDLARSISPVPEPGKAGKREKGGSPQKHKNSRNPKKSKPAKKPAKGVQ